MCDCTDYTHMNLADEELVKSLIAEMNLALFRMGKAIEACGGRGGGVERRMQEMRSVRKEGADDIGLCSPG